MTTEKSADTTTNCSGLDDSRSPIKRYDFGQNSKQGYSVPDIIKKADGRFVLYEDAFKLLKMIQLNEALLAKQAVEMEAIGAGGVSGRRITGPGAYELVADAAEIIDTLTSNLPDDHPIREAAKRRAKQRVQELYLLAGLLINVRI